LWAQNLGGQNLDKYVKEHIKEVHDVARPVIYNSVKLERLPKIFLKDQLYLQVENNNLDAEVLEVPIGKSISQALQSGLLLGLLWYWERGGIISARHPP
jgi:hypothetical protein